MKGLPTSIPLSRVLPALSRLAAEIVGPRHPPLRAIRAGALNYTAKRIPDKPLSRDIAAALHRPPSAGAGRAARRGLKPPAGLRSVAPIAFCVLPGWLGPAYTVAANFSSYE